MKAASIDFCLQVSLAHASLHRKLDDVLGTLHGLGYADFMLLHLLAQAEGEAMAVADLARPLGLRVSGVVRQLLPLEKTGHVERRPGLVQLRRAGRVALGEARVTADAVCAEALWDLPSCARQGAEPALQFLARSDSLELA